MLMREKQKTEKKKITVGLVASWIFGILFTFLGLGLLIGGSYFTGILVILGTLVLIPYFERLLSNKFHFEFSTGIRWVIVIVVVILFFVGMGSSTKDLTASNIEQGAETSPQPTLRSLPEETTDDSPEVKTYSLGDEIQAGDFKWKIIKVTTAREIGEDVYGTFFGERADGIFVIMEVEVENTGDHAEYLMDSFVKLVDDKSRQFSPNSVAAFYLKPEGSGLLFEQINPGIKKKGKIVYDVPEGLTLANIIISSDLFSNSLYQVELMI